MNLIWGQKSQLQFHDEHEYYETLGFLAKNTKTKVYFHNNQRSGAWGHQGKIERVNCLPSALPRALAAISNNHDKRISVTDYVHNLVNTHNFQLNGNLTADYTVYAIPVNTTIIRATVDPIYIADFDRGYSNA